jgi:NAD(P)-dependent dehydrogenase (short-subunit alcohol dehydrogenase family)
VHEAEREIGATGLRADVTDPAVVAAALARTGPLDVLVNNAGLERITPADDGSPEAVALFRRILDINVTGMAIVTAQALGAMGAGGRILNTASIWGRVGEPLFGAYVASKHAVIGLTKTWAKELGPRGIRVNAVAPGWVCGRRPRCDRRGCWPRAPGCPKARSSPVLRRRSRWAAG